MKISQGVSPFDRYDPWPYLLGVNILFVAAAGTIFLALLRPLLARSVSLTLALALAVVLLTPWMTRTLATTGTSRWVLAYVAGDSWWSYFPWFPWLAYPLLGFAWHGAAENARCGTGVQPADTATDR